MIHASIVGGSGYAGGELIRLLSGHEQVEIKQIASASRAGRPVHSVNPNLRKSVPLKFCAPQELAECDVLFLCLPHGQTMSAIDHYMTLAPKIIDLGGDFRLNDAEEFERWYGKTHSRPDMLDQFCYGIPELHRDRIADSDFVSCAGCNATTVILGVLPIVRHFKVESIVAEAKVGSSEGGSQSSDGSHHPLRRGAVRSYRPVGHRHTGEMMQELGLDRVSFSATSIEMVRGVAVTAHLFMDGKVPEDKELWKAYRNEYANEPFVRIVKDRSGLHRLPEPKHLAGTNYCDVGFETDPENGRIVAISALDNLMKGAAGQAIQNMNLMFGLPEAVGLEFTGLFPI